jgi:hypothetical protein
MTTPPGPDEPRYATGYGGARYPLPPEGAPGSSPAPGAGQYPGAPPYPGQYPPGQQYQPTGGYPYGQQYSPYGAPPAGTEGSAPPPRRPGAVVLGLVLMALAALPFLAFGLVFLLAPLGPEVFPADVLATPGLAEAGITTADQLVAVLRGSGAVFTALAVVYLVIVVLGFVGQRWARILAAVMTGGFAALLLLIVLSAITVDPVSAVVLLVPLVLSVAGIALWFLPQSSRWYASR